MKKRTRNQRKKNTVRLPVCVWREDVKVLESIGKYSGLRKSTVAAYALKFFIEGALAGRVRITTNMIKP